MRVWTAMLLGLIALSPSQTVLGDSKATSYHVIKKLPLGGDGGWDYLSIDSAARRLYISRSNRVMVIDVDTGELVGTVNDTRGIHGIALAPELNRGFTSNGADASVTVFDLKTLKTQGKIKVGNRPDAIIYDPHSRRVFTFNAGSKDATAVDAATEKVAGSVPLGGKPEFAVSDEAGHIYANVEDKSEIIAFNAQSLEVEHHWPLAPGKEPTGLSMDRKQRRLFASCHNQKMVVLDADSGKVLATPAIGRGTDACIFDAELRLAFSSNGEGTLTIVEETPDGQYRVAATVPTQAGARTMALDTKTHQLFLATARSKPGQPRSQEPNSFTVLVVGPG